MSTDRSFTTAVNHTESRGESVLTLLIGELISVLTRLGCHLCPLRLLDEWGFFTSGAHRVNFHEQSEKVKAFSLTALTPLPPGSGGAPMGLFASLSVFRASSLKLGSV
jgi:hypothetical protein